MDSFQYVHTFLFPCSVIRTIMSFRMCLQRTVVHDSGEINLQLTNACVKKRNKDRHYLRGFNCNVLASLLLAYPTQNQSKLLEVVMKRSHSKEMTVGQKNIAN